MFDYPFLESIQSILPLCDEFVIVVGKSDDDTLSKIRSLNHPGIKIIETTWDESLRSGGAILAQQTNIALSHTRGDWAFYLQGDEVVHEQDLPIIQRAMEQYRDDRRVEGLLFDFIHFYGSYAYVGNSRRWYRREIRIVRTGIGVSSWQDAQGFRIGARKMNVVPIGASIYHYGWVKPPRIQLQKQKHFNRLWHPDAWIADHVQQGEQYDYSTGGILTKFRGTHPAGMRERIQSQDWTFSYDPANVKHTTRESVLMWIEEKTGRRLGEYKNYLLL